MKLWRAQIAALLRLELKKHFLSKRAIPVYLLAAAPVLLFGIHGLLASLGMPCRGRGDLRAFAATFQVYYLRLGIFFGCVGIFMSLFRGEAVEKTLHYYFLAPVRREVLVLGKYLAGLAMGLIVFGAGTLLSYLFMDLHSAPLRNEQVLSATALGHIAGYTGVTALAVLGYGAVFLFLGLYFRNPIIPGIVVLVWESINVFLPPMLKKVSVIFYLESLCPIQIPAGADRVFAMTADPVPAYIGVPGLILLTLVVIAASALRIRGMEISYGGE